MLWLPFLLTELLVVQCATQPFVATWRTTVVNERVTLPVTLPLAASLNISWGDASNPQIFNPGTGTPINHTYTAIGLHNVSILGDLTGFRFNSQGDRTKLVDILSWGDSFIMDGTSTYAFAGCTNLKISAPPNTNPVFSTDATLQGMFCNSSVNSPFNWSLTNVISLKEMFRGATQMNQPINFANTMQVTDISAMFHTASNFNSPLFLDSTVNVTVMTDLFSYATSFNQPIVFDTRNVVSMDYVFDSASRFNQPVNFDTSKVTTMTGMFYDAIKFNQPVNFDTRNVVAMATMFTNATSFNQPVNFNTSKVTTMSRMFAQARTFNQSVNFNTSRVTNMGGMFNFATSFNQPIDFQADSLITASQMFDGAKSFNQPVVLRNSNRVTTMARMFANIPKCYNNTVTISSTANVTDMTNMFLGVVGFQQNLDSWNTSAVMNCSGFCPTCGLPSFPACVNPCGDASKLPVNGSAFVCGFDTATCAPLCELVNVSTNLQVQCLPNTTATKPPTPGTAGGGGIIAIISPLFNITQDDTNDTNASTFVFTLPIDPALYEVGKVTQGCQGDALSCEWQDPDSLEFRQSGCEVSNARVNLGSGIVGTQCTCVHLTVFAIVLRPQLRAAPLCHAEEIDYALLALYCILACMLLFQLTRIVSLRLFKSSFPQHVMLLLACVLRALYLVLKPVIHSLAGLVILGLLPSAMALTLFIHLLLVWASLQLGTVQLSSPFERFRKPFIGISFSLYALVAVLAVVVTLAPGNNEIEIVRDGSYVFAGLTALVCVLVLMSGLGLYRSLGTLSHAHSNSHSTSHSTGHSTTGSHSPSSHKPPVAARDQVRRRLLLATIGLSLCLFVVACLWAAAVQTDILVSSAATLATTASFYVFDWLSLCVMTWMFSTAVKRAADVKSRTAESQQGSNY